MKPADELRAPLKIKGAGPIPAPEIERRAADLLDECERLVADLIQWDNREGRDPWEPLIKNARTTLAKLRGQA